MTTRPQMDFCIFPLIFQVVILLTYLASTQTAAIGCRGDILMNLFKFNRKYGERGIFCRNIIKVAYQGAYLHRGGYDKSALLPHAQLCRKLELLKKIEQGIIFRLV